MARSPNPSVTQFCCCWPPTSDSMSGSIASLLYGCASSSHAMEFSLPPASGSHSNGSVPTCSPADHTGVYGISFLIVLVNVAFAELFLWIMPFFRGFHPVQLPWELLTTAAACMVLSWFYSSAVLSARDLGHHKPSVTIGVVQPNIDQAVKWDASFRDET